MTTLYEDIASCQSAAHKGVRIMATQFTAAQLREMLKEQEEVEAKLAEEKGAEIRAELEKFVMKKYGVSLEAIGLVEKAEPTKRTFEVKWYRNPADKKVYRYKGFGGIAKDVKTWLCDKDGNRIESYRCSKAEEDAFKAEEAKAEATAA